MSKTSSPEGGLNKQKPGWREIASKKITVIKIAYGRQVMRKSHE